MKRVRMSCRVLVCGLAVAGALMPGSVHAQGEPADRASVRVGPFQFSPRLSFTNMGIDYNVFNERTNPKRDFTFVAAPDLEIALNPGRLRLTYTSGAEFVYFREFTSERSVNRRFGGTADLDLTMLKPFATMSFAHTSARPNAEIDVRARHHPRVFTAGTRLKLATRSEMVFTVREARDTYDEGLAFRGVELARTLDQNTRSYDTAFNVALTPFTTVGLVVSKERETFRVLAAAELGDAADRAEGDVQSARSRHRQRVRRVPALQGGRSDAAGLQRSRLHRHRRHPLRGPLQAGHHVHARCAVLGTKMSFRTTW